MYGHNPGMMHHHRGGMAPRSNPMSKGVACTITGVVTLGLGMVGGFMIAKHRAKNGTTTTTGGTADAAGNPYYRRAA